MSILSNHIKAAIAEQTASFYPKLINDSLRFDGNSAYLSRTPSTAGNRKTWTYSTWVKRAATGASQSLFAAGVTGGQDTSRFLVAWSGLDQIAIIGASDWLRTTALYIDSNAWYNVVIAFDSTNATVSDRLRLTVNGVRVTSFSSNRAIPLDQETGVNSTELHQISEDTLTGQTRYHLDAYLSNTNFIDGQALDATAFGEFKNGVWVPKDYVGSYGTNGFKLDFANPASPGNDVSGNANHWTANSIAAHDVVLDSPTNNFPTLNALDKVTGTLSQGNLHIASSGALNALSSMILDGGSYYFETFIELRSSSSNAGAGVGNAIGLSGDELANFILYNPSGTGRVDGVDGGAWGAPLTTGDVLGLHVDTIAKTVTATINGVSQGSVTWTGDYTNIKVRLGDRSGTVSIASVVNFGQDSTFAGNTTAGGNSDDNSVGDFKYPVPAGALALCAANLPEPTIGPNSATQATEHFKAFPYIGDGVAPRAYTGLGFAPDVTWAKNRGLVAHHQLFNSLSGDGRRLVPSLDISETVNPSGGWLQLDADGFTAIAGSSDVNNVNYNTYPFISWNWKMGGAAIANNDGTIASQVSANQIAGQCLLDYTGIAAIGTVGHGLLEPLDLLIVNNTDDPAGQPWVIYHARNTDQPETDYLVLNELQATVDDTLTWNDTAPTASVFTVGASAASNQNADRHVAMGFHEVEGYSKFGVYIGDASVDGPFVYTGFKPALVITKDIDGLSNHRMYDNQRDGFNEANFNLNANTNGTEGLTAGKIQLLSNGFKVTSTDGDINESGNRFIYIAIAEMPFKYANAA